MCWVKCLDFIGVVGLIVDLVFFDLIDDFIVILGV